MGICNVELVHRGSRGRGGRSSCTWGTPDRRRQRQTSRTWDTAGTLAASSSSASLPLLLLRRWRGRQLLPFGHCGWHVALAHLYQQRRTPPPPLPPSPPTTTRRSTRTSCSRSYSTTPMPTTKTAGSEAVRAWGSAQAPASARPTTICCSCVHSYRDSIVREIRICLLYDRTKRNVIVQREEEREVGCMRFEYAEVETCVCVCVYIYAKDACIYNACIEGKRKYWVELLIGMG